MLPYPRYKTTSLLRIRKKRTMSFFKKILVTATSLMVVCGCFSIAQAQRTMGIAAVVNDDAISFSDVEDRIKLVLASSGMPDGKEIRLKIMPQVVEGLVEESLKLQEAARVNLPVSDEEIKEGLGTIAKQNNLTADQFTAQLKKAGINEKTLNRQIKAQLAWNNVVKKKLRSEVSVSETDITNYIEDAKKKIGQTEYRVSEIFLPYGGQKKAAELDAFAGRMAKALQKGEAPFAPVAAQFSKAAGAEKGGSLGWITEGNLAPELDAVLKTLSEKQISDPIKTKDGLYILQLSAKRTMTAESIPDRESVANEIGFQRLDRVQKRALMDLKSSAFIDRRYE